MIGAAALKFKQTNVTRQPGELARIKIVQGPDYGTIFVITAQRVSIGRGEDNDIVITDLKASRNHAEFDLGGQGWFIKDLGSANGLLFNGKPMRNAQITSKDVITLGETTLEFYAGDTPTRMLVSSPRSAQTIQSDLANFEQQKKNVQQLGFFGQIPGLGGQPILGQPGTKRQGSRVTFLIILVGVVFVGLQVLDDSPGKKLLSLNSNSPYSGRDTGAERDLASYLPNTEQGAVAKAAETFFRSGFREYREGNFIRARTYFETVIQISPSHRLGKIYLENCNKKIDDEVKGHLQRGKKDLASGKLKEAQGHFEAVLRLLYKNSASPDFLEAKDQLAKVKKEISGSSAGGGAG